MTDRRTGLHLQGTQPVIGHLVPEPLQAPLARVPLILRADQLAGPGVDDFGNCPYEQPLALSLRPALLFMMIQGDTGAGIVGTSRNRQSDYFLSKVAIEDGGGE